MRISPKMEISIGKWEFWLGNEISTEKINFDWKVNLRLKNDFFQWKVKFRLKNDIFHWKVKFRLKHVFFRWQVTFSLINIIRWNFEFPTENWVFDSKFKRFQSICPQSDLKKDRSRLQYAARKWFRGINQCPLLHWLGLITISTDFLRIIGQGHYNFLSSHSHTFHTHDFNKSHLLLYTPNALRTFRTFRWTRFLTVFGYKPNTFTLEMHNNSLGSTYFRVDQKICPQKIQIYYDTYKWRFFSTRNCDIRSS